MVFQVGILELNLGAPAYIVLSLMAFGMLYFLFYCEKHTFDQNISNHKTIVVISILKGVLIRFLIVLPILWGIFGSPYAPYPESMLDILFLAIIGSIVFLRSRVFTAHTNLIAKNSRD